MVTPQRIVFPAIVLACLVAVGIVGFIRFRQSVEKEKYYRIHDPKYGVHIVGPDSEKVAQDHRQRFIDQAMLIREKWRPYAYQKKSLLKRMVRCNGQDKSLLQEVYEAVPSEKSEIGITTTDFHAKGLAPLTVSLPDGRKMTMPDFTWNAFKPTKQTFNSAKGTKEYDKSVHSMNRKMEADFSKFKDFSLSESASPSSSTLFIWASGRVTEEDRSHLTAANTPQEVEIAPQFEFL